MNKTFKFDGSQSSTYSQYVPENYAGFKIAMVAVAVVAVALVIFFAQYM